MSKLIAAVALVFLSSFAFGQTTAVVTGALVDQSETGTSSGISVDVTLVNTGSQRCFVNGTGTLVKEKTNYTAAQILAGITLAKTANITCGSTSGQTRWRFTFKNAALNTARDCDLQITGATSLNTATCLQAATTPTTTVPTSSLFLLLDGSNSPTGNLVPAVNGTQSIGTSGSRWNMFANTADISGNETVGGTLGVTGASTLANVTMGAANTLSVNNIKQQAGAAFVLADPLGPSHIFISSSSPYTNTFINGNGAGVVFLGSAAKTSVADTSGNIVTAGSVALQTTSQTLPATIANSGDGSVSITDNATHLFKFDNTTGTFIEAGNGIGYQGFTSGKIVLKAAAVAGSNTLTLPAATDTISCNGCTQTLTATTLGGTTPFKRLRANQGTALIAGDFAISAGWGNTASLGSVLGTDAAFSAVVTSAGTGQSAGPTVTLTFHDGTWTNSPICTLAPGPGNNVLATWLIQSVSATALVVQATLISANFTPSAGNTVGLTASCVGR